MKRAHRTGEAAVLAVALGVPTLNRTNSTRGRSIAGPYRSFAILEQRSNALSGKLRVAGQFAVLPTCQPLPGADPETPVVRGK